MQTPQPPASAGQQAAGPSALESAAKQATLAHYTRQVLQAELEHAHRLITLLLQELTPTGLARFAQASEQAGIGTEGATRHYQRAAALALATQGAHHG